MDTVEIVDPTHPLYGKTLPLVGVTTRQRLGRTAVVWLYPGVERCVPLSATDLAEIRPAPPSSSRLSVASLERLLAVVASLLRTDLEDAESFERMMPPVELAPALRAQLSDLGKRLPELWDGGRLSAEHKKSS